MRKLLCWCIWLLLSNAVVGGWWPVAGEEKVVGSRWPVIGQKTVAPRLLDSPQPATSHQPPTTNHLPCADSAPACLETLGNLAVQNSRERVVLEQAIQLQKKKLWTNWLNADGLNPLAIGLRIARNIAGGGDHAAAKLEIARLELRRGELETELRTAILRAVQAYETAQRQGQDRETKLTTHRNRLQLLTVAYRFGEGSTETMLQLWQTETELQRVVENAQLVCQQRFVQLQSLVNPSFTSKPIQK